MTTKQVSGRTYNFSNYWWNTCNFMKYFHFIAFFGVTLNILNLGSVYGEYNTEVVCFDNSGDIVFYETRFPPSDPPIRNLTGDIYKVVSTGKKLYGHCKIYWGTKPPKGREYWVTKKDY